LIHSLTGTERPNLLAKCLELFAETGEKCYSLTFDGASSILIIIQKTLSLGLISPQLLSYKTNQFIFYGMLATC